MKAVIITGGKGERLRPLTHEIPKALLPLKGRYLLDHVIDLFFKYHVYEVWFSLGHKSGKILKEYRSAYPYFKEAHPMGTGGWLKSIKENAQLKILFNTHFFACNGDNLFNLDLSEMLKQHLNKDAVVTIACTKVKDVSQYGSVHIKNNWIQSFEEKKKSRVKKSGWINGGYYIFSPKIFDYIDEGKESLSLERDVFPKIAKDGKLLAFKSKGQWFDTGTFERYDDVIKNWEGI